MTLFFNRQRTWKATFQAYNLLVMGIAAYDFLTNPRATFSEHGTDLAIHALTILTLREVPSGLTAGGTSLLNVMRLGAIYAGMTSGCSALTSIANIADALTHACNALATFDVAIDTIHPIEPTAPKAAH